MRLDPRGLCSETSAANGTERRIGPWWRSMSEILGTPLHLAGKLLRWRGTLVRSRRSDFLLADLQYHGMRLDLVPLHDLILQRYKPQQQHSNNPAFQRNEDMYEAARTHGKRVWVIWLSFLQRATWSIVAVSQSAVDAGRVAGLVIKRSHVHAGLDGREG